MLVPVPAPALVSDSEIPVDVGSTLAALARTLDSDQLSQAFGRTINSANSAGPAESELLGGVKLSADGRYEQIASLGCGGMGRVDAVWDRDLMRELAVKQLHTRLADDGLSLRQFLWEARVTAHLDHPNIVPVHDLGLDANGQLFFTMKRVRGRSLAELCDLLTGLPTERRTEIDCCLRAKPEPGEDCLVAEYGPRKRRLRVFVEICQAIAYAHDRGVLHRDLKPANAMIGEFGEVLVMDWGLALPMRERGDTALSQLMPADLQATDDKLRGTPRYMAPELLLGKQADVRTDIYSLGVLLYELLALRRPHDATSVPALVVQITEGTFTPLAIAAPDLPSSVVAVVERAMACDPERRYASVRELMEDVEAVLEGLTPVAEQASHITKVRRYFWSRDNPDAAHIRLVDLDLIGVTGVAFGIGATLFMLQGFSEWVLGALVVGAASAVAPAQTYLRAVRGGRRRMERDRERERARAGV
jgi:eukaryotic-like serine/threonine-protein kinase